jgi:hypothetical protein
MNIFKKTGEDRLVVPLRLPASRHLHRVTCIIILVFLKEC